MEYTVKNFAEEVANKVSEMMGEDFHVEINPVAYIVIIQNPVRLKLLLNGGYYA